MTRPYLLAMACGAFAATAIVAAVCWVVDPLGIYDSPRIEGFDALKPALKTRSRVFKTVRVTNGQHRQVVVRRPAGGAAVLRELDRADAPRQPGGPTVGERRLGDLL